MPGYNIIGRFLGEMRKGGLQRGSTVLEIGTGKSTTYFLQLAWALGCKFITVDMDPDTIYAIKELIKNYPLVPGSRSVNMKGEDYLKRYTEKDIVLTYVDAYDYNHGNLKPGVIDFYRKKNLPLDKESCWESHLEIAKELQKKMVSGGYICMDDVYSYEWDGKGFLAIPYLLKEGYRIMAYSSVDRAILLKAP